MIKSTKYPKKIKSISFAGKNGYRAFEILDIYRRNGVNVSKLITELVIAFEDDGTTGILKVKNNYE